MSQRRQGAGYIECQNFGSFAERNISQRSKIFEKATNDYKDKSDRKGIYTEILNFWQQ